MKLTRVAGGHVETLRLGNDHEVLTVRGVAFEVPDDLALKWLRHGKDKDGKEAKDPDARFRAAEADEVTLGEAFQAAYAKAESNDARNKAIEAAIKATEGIVTEEE